MPETQTQTQPEPAIPVLACPNCGANLLDDRHFYNYCTEIQRLREDSYTHVVNGRLYIDHDENSYQTEDHECDMEAYCGNCHQILPWALYQIRELDGELLPEAERMIADLLAEIAPQTSEGPAAERSA